jgi:cobaltochelatase CobT
MVGYGLRPNPPYTTMAQSKHKESPAEPFKRVLGLAVRAIAGDGEMQVNYAPGQPELDGKTVQLPEPSRLPSLKEIAVVRGWADSLALTAACHDAKLHSRLAPRSGPAKAVFEAVERARIEALGSNRMPGMAANLTARVEDQYGHGRYAEVTDRADAPLEDALALIVREQLTGAAPPKTAKAMVDLWRPWIEERVGRTLSQLNQLAEDQAAFGQVIRDVLKTLDLSDELSEGERDEGEEEQPDEGDQQAEESQEGQEAQEQASDGSPRRGRGGRACRESGTRRLRRARAGGLRGGDRRAPAPAQRQRPR